MWEIDSSFQAVSFLYSVLFGVGYCLFYDLFRAFRKLYNPTAISVFFEDLIYFLIISFLTFLLLMSLSNGEVRGYIIFGIAVGFAVCYFTVSRFFVKILFAVFKYLNEISAKMVDFLNRILIWLFEKIKKWVKYCNTIFDKTQKIFKKDLKKEG